jgi:hypothetical protein
MNVLYLTPLLIFAAFLVGICLMCVVLSIVDHVLNKLYIK